MMLDLSKSEDHELRFHNLNKASWELLHIVCWDVAFFPLGFLYYYLFRETYILDWLDQWQNMSHGYWSKHVWKHS